MGESLPDIDGLCGDDLKSLLLRVLEENAALRAEVAALRQENRRLKGLKGPPSLKPSGMDKGSEATSKRGSGKRRRGPKNARLTVDEDRILTVEAPAGSRFKGYEDFTVQDLVIKPRVIRYRRERWLTPHGETLVAPLPPGLAGHFGPEMRCFVLAQYHQGQLTVERLTALLRGLGIDLSKRQVVRLLTAGKDGFLDENRAVLRTGLETAVWITADDTGARHADRNAICTRIGNDRFAWFATTFSKSRLNFLRLLRAGDEVYGVNEAALDYMRTRQLPGPVIARLAAHGQRRFASQQAWTAHLQDLAITARAAHPDPVRIATEGALWGALVARGRLDETVILSDDAGQFNVGRHALCWVHAERLVHQLDTFCERQRQAKEAIQARIWRLYADLKAYCRDPTPAARRALGARFDHLFKSRTGFATLDRLLARLHANRAELLMVLERPDVPLHTNDAENDIRCQVTRRKLSGGTRSEAGRECRDAFLGLMKTCNKLGIRFWDYLGCRLDAPGAPYVAPLPQLIRQAAST
ncbi:MAG TPA: transposase [Alphaproteobacteria bacterium]